MKTVWLKGACILSAILLSTSMGGAWQPVSAADDQVSGQTVDQTGLIEAPLAVESNLAAPSLATRAVFHTRNQINYTFVSPTTPFVPLTVAGALQSDSFNASGRFVVTYEAECGVVASTSTNTWLDIDIQLFNATTGALVATLPPTDGTADALCTSNGTGFYQWRRSSVTAIAGEVTAIPAGTYYVRILAKLQSVPGSGAIGWLGDTTLVIRK